MIQSYSTDFDFVHARLHGLKSRLLEGNRLLELTHKKSLLDLGRSLDPPLQEIDPDRFVFRAVSRHLDEMRHLLLLLGLHHARVVSALLSWYDLENVKTLVRALVRGWTLERSMDLLGPWWTRPPLKMELVPQAKTLQDLGNLLHEMPYKTLLFQETKEVDLHRWAAQLDLAYFENLGNARGKSGKTWGWLCDLEADIQHLQILLQGEVWYNMKPLDLEMYWTPQGTIPFSILKTLPPPEPLDAFVRALPEPFTSQAHGLLDLEDHLWDTLARAARSEFLSPKRPFSRVVAFCYLKRMEATNLIRLCQGIEMRLSPREIASRLLGFRIHLGGS